MNDHLYAVIIAGGVGSRLWPRSRTASPKQFLDLQGPRTMLQDTVARIEPLIPLSRLLVVVSADHAAAAHSQVPGLPKENVIVEPGPRGTAPCIGLAAVALQIRDPQATMAVFPADHCIKDAAGFRRAIAVASEIAQDAYLVTLGITPSGAQTGYGYIQRGALLEDVSSLPAYRVQRFTEKPDAVAAQEFVDSGQYYWNGGIFVWRVATILAEMERLLPDLSAGLQTLNRNWGSGAFSETLARTWEKVPRTTIDYGIMERAARVAVVPVDIGWDDVGNWSTLSELVESDQQGNVVHGSGQTELLDSTNTYLYTTAGRLVAAIGLDGFVVVDTPDAVLICPKSHAQAVRDVVDRLKASGLQEYL